MKKNLILYVVSFILLGCSQVHYGGNYDELHQVVELYVDEGKPLKAKAAQFIIDNIEYHYSYDTSKLCFFRTQLVFEDSIIQSKGDVALIYDNWLRLLSSYPVQNAVYDWKISDIELLNTSELKLYVDNAYQIWLNNPHRDLFGFDNFCNYILPPKVFQGMSNENVKPKFEQYRILARRLSLTLSPQEVLDSILSLSSFAKLDYPLLEFPFLKLEDIEMAVNVDDRVASIYNAIVCNSIGYPVSIDCIPAWGNRSGSLTWNSFLSSSTESPFGAFKEPCRWKYRKLFNNKESTDYCKVRLPKVFRYSYRGNMNSLLRSERAINTPNFFKDPLLLDVSERYFETSDVEIDIPRWVENNNNFVWLSVFDNGNFVPVQWSNIDKGRACFERMGRDIVYFPIVYLNGFALAFGDPMLVDSVGSVRSIVGLKETETVKVLRKSPKFCSNDRFYMMCSCSATEICFKHGDEVNDLCDSSLVSRGSLYELIFWNKKWISLGSIEATDNFVEFKDVPKGALLWLRSLSDQWDERPFVYHNGCQQWW